MSRRTLAFVVLLGVALLLVFPFYFLLAGALSTEPLMHQGELRLLPPGLTLAHVADLWQGGRFGRFLVNSVVVAAGVVAGNLMLSACAGYVFARKRFTADKLLFSLVLASLMVPKQLLMIPLYLLCSRLHIRDTYAALILPFWADAFNVFLIRQALSQQPETLEDAARLDGAGEWMVFRRIVWPLLGPTLVFCALNTMIVNWNSILFPLVLISNPDLYTLPVGLMMTALGPNSLDWQHLFAGCFIATVPLVVLFLIFRHRLHQGMVMGAMKG